MSFTDTFETRVLTWVFTTSSATRPTAWFVALYTAAPNDAGGGTEVSGAGYVRKAATFTVSGDTASNSGAIEYPTATGNYGTVSHVGIFDASSGGNLIAYAALTVSKTISTGDVLRIPAGDLDVTLS
jgi:hypothetical protein|tara:strand:+ start:557 stop:937 length:381 start_codon:yes stop_codon:yes gene_type:complete